MKVKLTHFQILHLFQAFNWKADYLASIWTAKVHFEHEDLFTLQQLKTEFVADFVLLFGLMLDRQKKTYQVNFSSLQASAFMMLWEGRILPPDVISSLEIQNLIKIFDKASKSKILQQ